MFTSINFTYDSTPNSSMGVYLVGIGSAEKSAQFGIARSIDFEKIRGNPKPYFYGVIEEPLSFQISLAKDDDEEWTMQERKDLAAWLFPTYYKDFTSDDDEDIVYRCMPQERPEKVLYGNVPRIFTLNMMCDSPWAYEEKDLTIAGSTPVENTSNVYGWNYYPPLQFVSSGGTFSIINHTTNITTTITDLTNGEVIYMNGQRKQLISSLGEYRLSDFNKNFFYLLPGINVIEVLSGTSSVDLECLFPIAV